MKKTITLFAILLSIITFSQEFQFEEVVKVDSTTTKEELYNRARIWANQSFKSKKTSVNIEDKDDGEIAGTGVIDYRTKKNYLGASCIEGPISYKMNIYIKDGRYKYQFHTFDHKGSKGSGCKRLDLGVLRYEPENTDKGFVDIIKKITEFINPIILDLKSAMNKEYEASKDW